MEIEINGEKKKYEELYLENKYLSEVLKGNIANLGDILKKDIIGENFSLLNPEFDGDSNSIYRVSEPGKLTGITTSYIRKIIDGNEFNNWEKVKEEIDFYKDANHSIFLKKDYLVKVFFSGDSKKISDIIKMTKKIFKNISFELDRPNNEEFDIRFGRSSNMKHEIYFAYKVLRDYISKGL